MSSVQTQACPSDEATLVSRCLSGEAAAWQEIVLRYQRLIYSVARLHFRNPAIADDVFQDVCLELYRRLDSIRDVKALPAWLITVTRRKCAKALKDRLEWTDVDAENMPVIEQKIAAVEKRFWIEKALTRLSDRDQALIEALYFDPDQPSYEDIASRLKMPVSSIGPTRARCLEKLRKHWNGQPQS